MDYKYFSVAFPFLLFSFKLRLIVRQSLDACFRKPYGTHRGIESVFFSIGTHHDCFSNKSRPWHGSIELIGHILLHSIDSVVGLHDRSYSYHRCLICDRFAYHVNGCVMTSLLLRGAFLCYQGDCTTSSVCVQHCFSLLAFAGCYSG